MSLEHSAVALKAQGPVCKRRRRVLRSKGGGGLHEHHPDKQDRHILSRNLLTVDSCLNQKGNQFSPVESVLGSISRCRDQQNKTKRAFYFVWVFFVVYFGGFCWVVRETESGGVGAKRKNVIKICYMKFFSIK